LRTNIESSPTGLSPSKVLLSRRLRFDSLASYPHHISTFFSKGDSVCPMPFSLAASKGIALLSFPAGTKMFQFPACVCLSAYSEEHVIALGDPGFKGRMHLAQAYRSLPRPSSQSKPSYPSISLNI
jgi:hypothetical protein